MGSKKNKYIQIMDGQTSVLLSAPHAFDHRRPSLTTLLKQAEPWTDVIVNSSASDTNCFGIIQREASDFDPNYHPEESNPYKQQIRDLTSEKNVDYVLDVHGLSDQYPLDVVIYYPMRFRKSRKVADALADMLDRNELKGLSLHIYNFSSPLQETISEFVSRELKIPSVQIEVSRYIREDEELRNALIASLSDFISSYSLT